MEPVSTVVMARVRVCPFQLKVDGLTPEGVLDVPLSSNTTTSTPAPEVTVNDLLMLVDPKGVGHSNRPIVQCHWCARHGADFG